MKFISSALIVSSILGFSARAAFAESASGFVPTPFELSFIAYRGELKAQGIPGYDGLCAEIRSGKITPIAVINAAVTAGILDATEGAKKTFLQSLETALFDVCRR